MNMVTMDAEVTEKGQCQAASAQDADVTYIIEAAKIAFQVEKTGKKRKKQLENKEKNWRIKNKAVYTAASVAGDWAGAVMSWAEEVKAVRILKVKV